MNYYITERNHCLAPLFGQSNFYKLNHHYPEKKELQVKEIKPDRISLHDAVAVLQLKENISNRSPNYRSSTVYGILFLHISSLSLTLCVNAFLHSITYFPSCKSMRCKSRKPPISFSRKKNKHFLRVVCYLFLYRFFNLLSTTLDNNKKNLENFI